MMMMISINRQRESRAVFHAKGDCKLVQRSCSLNSQRVHYTQMFVVCKGKLFSSGCTGRHDDRVPASATVWMSSLPSKEAFLHFVSPHHPLHPSPPHTIHRNNT